MEKLPQSHMDLEDSGNRLLEIVHLRWNYTKNSGGPIESLPLQYLYAVNYSFQIVCPSIHNSCV